MYLYFCDMEMIIKTKKVAKGHYQFTYNGEVFDIKNNEGLLGFTWNCVHASSRKATECKSSKSDLMFDLNDYILEDFFTDKEYWPITIDENGLF